MYELVKLLHILLFVYWLGADLGVFYSSQYVTRADLSKEARVTSLRIMAWIDQVPRYCLIGMIPVGFTLATILGVTALPAWLLALLWVGGLVWIWAVWAQHHYQGQPLAQLITKVDWIVRPAVMLVLAGLGLATIFAGAPFDQKWFGAKLLILATMIACGLIIRVVIQPMIPAFGQIIAQGSTPELEATLSRTMAQARPAVLLIWAGLISAAYLGLAKPF